MPIMPGSSSVEDHVLRSDEKSAKCVTPIVVCVTKQKQTLAKLYTMKGLTETTQYR